MNLHVYNKKHTKFTKSIKEFSLRIFWFLDLFMCVFQIGVPPIDGL